MTANPSPTALGRKKGLTVTDTENPTIDVEPRTGLERRAFNLRAAAAAVNDPLFAPKIAVTCEGAADFIETEVAELRSALRNVLSCYVHGWDSGDDYSDIGGSVMHARAILAKIDA